MWEKLDKGQITMIHLFIRQTFIEHLLHASHFDTHWDYRE